ncbi:MAG: DNA topoisomerase [Eubacteriales bacterium]|jgi:DNA topoisomerase-3|nr:DNA topoisomerase [Eubacteriales bacterium]
MTLIIAEKPSLARNIVSAIGPMTRRSGYFEGRGYIITWVFGHLFSLADVEAYGSGSGEHASRWTPDGLPCFPDEYKFEIRRDGERKPDAAAAGQFEIIKALCLREDTDIIVNAGDADREGEIIVRTTLNQAFGCSTTAGKTFLRLWLPDQTDETIAKALSGMKDRSYYDNLANEGYARTYIDWLYGVNLTRWATLKKGSLLRVGRVIVPIVQAVYERDTAITNFTPEVYYAVISTADTNGEIIELQSKQKFGKDDLSAARELCDSYNGIETVVTSVSRKKETLAPGKLFSLSKLQNFLGKKYKMPMTDSLAAVQKLYEEGYVTYPRTDSEYLADAEKDKIKKIIDIITEIGYPVEFREGKTIFNDSRVEAHSAITPTHKIPDKSKLTPDEAQVYTAIFRRFAAVFCARPCVVEKTTVNISGGETFSLNGTVIREPGWTKYDDYTGKDKILPKLKKGDRINVEFKPSPKQTNPPKHYTIETLNNYLKNPFREDKAALNPEPEPDTAEDEAEYRAVFEGLQLGTEATRTGIIDKAIKSNYIQLKKDVYRILPDGADLVRSLVYMNIGIDKYKTAEMGRALKKVYRGEMTIKEATALAEEEITGMFTITETEPEKDTDIGFYGDIIGRCPLCGGDVMRTGYGYGCNKYKSGCKFNIGGVICGRVISVSNARLLLERGITSKINGFISKKGKTFNAALKLVNGRAVFDF